MAGAACHRAWPGGPAIHAVPCWSRQRRGWQACACHDGIGPNGQNLGPLVLYQPPLRLTYIPMSAQASKGHPSTTCGGRWPGLAPGHDGNGESRSTAPDIIPTVILYECWYKT